MKHVFRATKLGWNREQECVWFDSNHYTKEEAEAQFIPYRGTTQKGYPYTGYEFDGEKYYDYYYLDEVEEKNMPHNIEECIEILLKRK